MTYRVILASAAISMGAAIMLPGVVPLRAEDAKDGAKRIDADDSELFGESPTRIDFETDPAGERLEVGEDLHKRFVDRGVLLSSSIKDAIVSVEDYEVHGRSRGHCAGTHDPLYQGTLTIRFCVPGEAGKPAGVHAVGFWVEHVAANGTSLVAYDRSDKRIGVLPTTKNRAQFLGIHSRRPIVRIDVVPNLDIDPDYAIDDLTFDQPVAIPQ